MSQHGAQHGAKIVTIEDVAIAAGVSVATVSRALRDLPNVAPSTRDRVRETAAALDYVADPGASRLAGGLTGTVAVAVPVLDSWYGARVVAGIEAILKESNVDLLLYAITNEVERQAFLAGNGAWWRRSDALIMVDLRISDLEAERLAAAGARIVTLGSRTPSFSSITLAETEAAAAAARYLIDAGHERIGMITGVQLAVHFRPSLPRRDSFRDVLVAAGLDVSVELETAGGFSIDGGGEAMAQLLDLPEPPTAVFAMSDVMAIGALHLARQRGLDVPGDVALVGFDDHETAPIFGLTTIHQEVDLIGAQAARLALRAMAARNSNDRVEPEHIVSPTHLVVRNTA